MRTALTIVDGFLPEDRFRTIRLEVLLAGFKTIEIQEQPGTDAPLVSYENVSILKYPDFREFLEYVYGGNVRIELQAFRLGFEGSKLHNKVHADHCCAPLAAVYYMNDLQDCKGGTAFWRHRKHGWEHMPTQMDLDKAGYTIKELSEDWHNEDAWDLVSVAGMKPNRLITYPTTMFHSRYPIEGLGEGEHSRLVWVAMFGVEP